MDILNTGTQRAAKTSKVSVGGGAVLAFASWSATVSSQDLNTTNFTSYNAVVNESFDEGLHAQLVAALTFGGDWDASTNPLDRNDPPGLYIRDDLENLKFFPSVLDALLLWTFPYARLRSAKSGGEVGGKVTFSVDQAMNQGIFTMPGS